MLVLAVVFSVVSGLVGTGVSYAVPRMPTGPWMVLVMVWWRMSFLFGTRKGLLPLWWKGQAIKKKIEETSDSCINWASMEPRRFLTRCDD